MNGSNVTTGGYNSCVSAPAVLVAPPGRHEKKRGRLPMRAQSSGQVCSKRRHDSAGAGFLRHADQVWRSPRSRRAGMLKRLSKSLAFERPRLAYLLGAERASERVHETARRRTTDAGRSGARSSLLASHVEARLHLGRSRGLSASGGPQHSTPTARGRCLLHRGASRRGVDLTNTSGVAGQGNGIDGTHARVCSRSAQRCGDQGRAGMIADSVRADR